MSNSPKDPVNLVCDSDRILIQRSAEAAGREIMRIYRSGNWSVTEKLDHSPVTQADLAANAILVPDLENLGIAQVISEENNPSAAVASERYWLVDPLDGTRDFIAKLDTFVVSIGLIQNSYPVFGLIHMPVTGETWWAQAGHGAYGPDGKRIFNSEKRNPLIAAGSRSMPSERMQVFYDKFSIQEVRRMGSAVKFCKLASGEVDLYPRFGPTGEWDTAGGQAIAEEAGCKLIDIQTGQRLKYGKPNFLNAGGFMASRNDLDIVSALTVKK